MSGLLQVPAAIVSVAVIAGGISGALHAGQRNIQATGILLVAVVTGLGGGAIRDILLAESVPVFLLNNLLAMACVGAVAGLLFARLVSQLEPAIFVVDTLLIGVWVIVGAEAAQNVGLPPLSAVFIGVTTAVGGGLLRDVLCREVPSALMPGQWVAASALVSALLFVAVDEVTGYRSGAQAAAIMSAILLRVASAQLNWITPSAVDLSDRLRGWMGLRRGRALEILRR